MTSKLEQAFLTYWIQLAPPYLRDSLISGDKDSPLVIVDSTGKKRKWRVDFLLPVHRIYIELEGAIYTAGRHSRGAGYTSDCHKYNSLTLMGWRGLRFTSDWLDSNQGLSPILMIDSIVVLTNRTGKI